MEGEVPPGGGFQIPHWHEDLDEALYVLEGEVEFLLDSRWRRASAGTTIFVPAGMAHAFRNASDRPARQLVIGPAEVAELIAELGEYPRERWEEVHERHRLALRGDVRPDVAGARLAGELDRFEISRYYRAHENG